MEYVAVLGEEEERESECCGENMSAPSRKKILLLLETARTDDRLFQSNSPGFGELQFLMRHQWSIK